MKTYVRKSDIAKAVLFTGGHESIQEVEQLCADAGAICKVIPGAYAFEIMQDRGDQMLALDRFELHLGDWLVYQHGYLAKKKKKDFDYEFTEHHENRTSL